MPIGKKFEKLDSIPIPLDNIVTDVPDDFDPRYDLQTKCDCGNEVWESGDIKVGHSTITGEEFVMKANLCTSCKAPQMWISRHKIKREEEITKGSSRIHLS